MVDFQPSTLWASAGKMHNEDWTSQPLSIAMIVVDVVAISLPAVFFTLHAEEKEESNASRILQLNCKGAMKERASTSNLMING